MNTRRTGGWAAYDAEMKKMPVDPELQAWVTGILESDCGLDRDQQDWQALHDPRAMETFCKQHRLIASGSLIEVPRVVNCGLRRDSLSPVAKRFRRP